MHTSLLGARHLWQQVGAQTNYSPAICGGAPSQGWSIDDVRDDAHPSWPAEEARVDADAPISEGYVFKSWVESPNGPKRSSVPADGGSSIGGASEEEMWCADPCIPSQSIVGTPTASHAC